MKSKKKDTKIKSTKNNADDKELKELEENYALLEQNLAESNDKFTRLFAEFDNYKKRTAREKLVMMSTANEDVIKSLLPVIDDFERALKASEDDSEKEGLSLIQNKLISILKTKGLEAVNTESGDTFDVDMHEAITTIPAPDESFKDNVVDVIEKGFKLGDKVIRYAKVVIGE